MPAENLPRATNDNTARELPSQQELFETNPPPWEMPVEQRVTLASVVFQKHRTGHLIMWCPKRCNRGCSLGCGYGCRWDIAVSR